MSLDVRRLAVSRRLADGTVVARCPACAAGGQDRKGEHLVVYPDGRFGCVVHPGEAGWLHRKRIWEAVGERGAKPNLGRRPPVVLKFTIKTKG
ncbi:MAG TPA: hypothetical protein VHP11_12485 [Tepidisphaeraceae bacterium]|nr:hypothetical protein [Tepidisphaeraceae bacterium]